MVVPPIFTADILVSPSERLHFVLKTFFFFEFDEFIPFTISSSGNICRIKFGIAEALFVSVNSESFSLGYFVSGVSSFFIWACGS